MAFERSTRTPHCVVLDFVLEIGVAGVPAIHRAWQADAVGFPVKQVESVRGGTLHVTVDDIAPYQIVGPQSPEGKSQLLARQNAAASDRRLAQRQRSAVDEQTDFTGIGEIDHRGKERHGRKLVFSAGGEYACGAAQDGATDAKPQRMNLVDIRYSHARRGTEGR